MIEKAKQLLNVFCVKNFSDSELENMFSDSDGVKQDTLIDKIDSCIRKEYSWLNGSTIFDFIKNIIEVNR
jgi:hypothetical protein